MTLPDDYLEFSLPHRIMSETEKRTQAWIGDAVLALYARQWILKQSGLSRTEQSDIFKQLTSNRFLASFGEPTLIEAEIGKCYQGDGLEAAFNYIEKTFIPCFKKQQANRKKQPGSYRDKA